MDTLRKNWPVRNEGFRNTLGQAANMTDNVSHIVFGTVARSAWVSRPTGDIRTWATSKINVIVFIIQRVMGFRNGFKSWTTKMHSLKNNSNLKCQNMLTKSKWPWAKLKWWSQIVDFTAKVIILSHVLLVGWGRLVMNVIVVWNRFPFLSKSNTNLLEMTPGFITRRAHCC